MTTTLLYLGGIFFFFLVVHLVRGRRSNLWRPSVARQIENNSPEAERAQAETQLAASAPSGGVQSNHREVVCH